MTVRRIVIALTVVGGSLVFASTTALAAGGPKVPAGCSFDKAQGVLTCVTAATTTSQLGPETTAGLWVPASTTFDGISGTQICMAVFGGIPGSSPATIEMQGSTYLTVATTVTTTTERSGMHGPVLSTSTSSATSLVGAVSGSMGCGWS